MTQKELRRLTRKQLLELLLTQTQQVNQLQETVDSLAVQLKEHSESAPVIAVTENNTEHLSHVFEAARLTADIYLAKVRNHEMQCAQMEDAARQRADVIIQEAQEQGDKIKNDANVHWEQTKQLINECLKQMEDLHRTE